MKNHLQRVAAVHDLSGIGHTSLTAIIPILSSMGIQVCPLPTAVLSANTAFPDFYSHDLTPQLDAIIDHWKKLKINFDAIYSGYLGSSEQVDQVKRLIADFEAEDLLVFVDPVLGDNGQLYTSFDQSMVEKMRELVTHAGVISPNLTEAAFLLGEKYHPEMEQEQAKEWARRLAAMGPRQVIITSVISPKAKSVTSVIAYNATDHRYWKVSCDYLPANYPGTGDAFASVMVGALLQGDSLPIALDRAVHFISLGVRATFGHNMSPAEGILLEKILPSLNAPVQLSSYQLLD